jgi:adenosylcobinamide-GDP ribazoletransferase
MTVVVPVLRSLLCDLRIGILFCTRLPLASASGLEGQDMARASWAMPVAGAIVGLFGAFIYSLAARLGVAPLSAAILGLAGTVLVTGALHEDGLADTADGFGGGNSSERKLEIMRDSRIGTYGVCALATSLGLRWSSLAILADPLPVTTALIAAHTSARAALPIFMRLVPPARKDGLSAAARAPPWGSVAAAAGVGLVGLAIGLGPLGLLIGLALLLLAGYLLGSLTMKQIGGQTGDVLGALEQGCEVLILLAAATMYGA